jgi:aryl-alcohol dehydrogenase-like predicted oxidoreductase
MLAVHPQFTKSFEHYVRLYVRERATALYQSLDTECGPQDLEQTQLVCRCMVGSGLVFEVLPLLAKLADSAANLQTSDQQRKAALLASIDGDLVQAITAVQKAVTVASGTRELSNHERLAVRDLFDSVSSSVSRNSAAGSGYIFDRGRTASAGILGIDPSEDEAQADSDALQHTPPPPTAPETFAMGQVTLPRIFSGLWQMSSPSWGSAPMSMITGQLSKHVSSGFTSFDMADHYGDAELIFGRFRARYPHKGAVFAATKICIFQRMPNVTREAMAANVSERCRRLQMSKLDLVQFHWQYYDDGSYLDALRFLQEDDRVGKLGLCNFDTANMQIAIESGIKIHTNQVQFSLIDSRPVERMAAFCDEHGVKLLTYGTLCGGFLSDKWLDKAEPDLYSAASATTPSQRKYFSMISNWGGWELLQELLQVLRSIATKHDVPGISNVATRWVLDWPCVGAVIVGARMGVSDHSDDNLASFGWSLDDEDREAIDVVLRKSKRKEMFEIMGDCGAEYRT